MISQKSSSLHRINADRPLSRVQRQLYMLFNGANNFFGHAGVDKSLQIREFDSVEVDDYWDRLYPTSSPSRKLSDLFWMTLPWADIKNELGEIKVLDIGCGTGDYGQRLQEYSENNISRYAGVDVKANARWEELTHENAGFQFTQVDSSVLPIPEGTTFIMSQSAIEHVEEDLSYFEQMRDYVVAQGSSVLQVHLVPAAACLKTYGYHGVRQYTPRTVSKLTRLFSDFSYTVLVGLGGRECNNMHLEYITRPLRRGLKDQRMERTDEYESGLYHAIKADMARPQKSPAFYALIIHSNWGKRLF